MIPSKLSILLVEHDSRCADESASSLSQNGWLVSVVSTGDQAVRSLEHDAGIDLVIMDPVAPSGADMAEAARELLLVRPVPIIVLLHAHDESAAAVAGRIPHCGLLSKGACASVTRTSVLDGLELFRARSARAREHHATDAAGEGAGLLSQDAIRLLFEHMDEGFVLQELVYDAGGVAYDYRFLIANRAYERHTGQRSDDILGKTLLEVVPHADRSMIQRYCHVALTREPMRVEYFSKTFGRYIRVSTFSPAFGQFASIFEDISDRKRTEQALIDATTYNRLIFDSSPIGMATYRGDGTAIAANHAAATITGGTAEALEGQNFRSLESWRSSGLCDAANDALALGVPTTLKIHGRSTFGRELWLSAVFTPFTHAGERELLAVLEDVSVEKESEEALQESEARYRTLFEMGLDGIVIRDLTGRPSQVNPAFAAMHGYTSEEILSRRNEELLFPESIDVLPTYLAAVREGKEVHGLLHSKHRDGRRLVLDVAAKKITMQEDDCILTLYRDITDRAEAEERIRALLQEKEVLLKEVHHRIKNNMSTIASLLALQAGMLRDPQAIGALKDAESRVKSMAMLYDKLYRAGNYSGLSAETYLSALSEEILKGFRGAARVRLVKDLLPFNLDTKRLSALSILVNELLTNSMKYAFMERESGTVRMASERKEGAVVITIADDGVGLPPEEKLSGDTFGLRLVHMLAEQIGASLEVTRDHGTEWRISFADDTVEDGGGGVEKRSM